MQEPSKLDYAGPGRDRRARNAPAIVICSIAVCGLFSTLLLATVLYLWRESLRNEAENYARLAFVIVRPVATIVELLIVAAYLALLSTRRKTGWVAIASGLGIAIGCGVLLLAWTYPR